MPAVEFLKKRLTRTLKARELGAALKTLRQLAKYEPNDPAWPRQAAHVFHAKRDTRRELAALRRALELQIDQSLVLDAIASCKAILEIVPHDSRTLEIQDLLYLEDSPKAVPKSDSEAVSGNTLPQATQLDPDAPLDTLILKDVVPGVQSLARGNVAPEAISEIPIDELDSRSGEVALDLKLEQASPVLHRTDVEAAQIACMPPRRARSRSRSNGERGASLRAELANIPLFGELDPASLHRLIRKVRVVILESGQVLFREGDPADTLYVVVDGAVVPIAEGERRHKLAVLERGEFFGEIGLVTNRPRNATIEALVDTKLLAIDRRIVWDLIGSQPSVAQCILRFLRARLIDRQIHTHLFFAAFAHAEREKVARQFRFLEVVPGTCLVEAGRPPEGLFVVLAGSLSVSKPAESGDKEIASLDAGDVFGGVWLLEGSGASANVIAKEKCWLVVLGEGRFRRILDANPRLERILRRVAAE